MIVPEGTNSENRNVLAGTTVSQLFSVRKLNLWVEEIQISFGFSGLWVEFYPMSEGEKWGIYKGIQFSLAFSFDGRRTLTPVRLLPIRCICEMFALFDTSLTET